MAKSLPQNNQLQSCRVLAALAFTMIQYRVGGNVENLIDKLSSYKIFNYLFPGVLFCVIADRYLSIPLVQDSIVTGLFFYYFVGLVISRFGSLVLEPIMKKLRFVKFSEYSDFVNAIKSDPKIEILSETNNMYRSVLSVFFLLCFIVLGKSILEIFDGLGPYIKYAILPVLVVLLGFSYKKQTSYIVKRIEANKDKPVVEVKN
jgi:hypothetical protein